MNLLNRTYLPHEAVAEVAEVSNHEEPIGRGRVEFNWFKSELMSDSNDFGCQLIWDSSDLVVKWFWVSNDLDVKWFQIQVIWLSTVLRFEWFGCQLIWDSSDLVVDLRFKWFGCQLMRDSNGLCCQYVWDSSDFGFQLISDSNEWGCQLICDSNALWLSVGLRCFEAQKRSFSARLPSKTTCGPDIWPQNSNIYVLAILKRMLQKYCVTPVIATGNDPCKATCPQDEICNPSTDSAPEASNIDFAKHEIPASATRKASKLTLFKKTTTPANVFATLTKSCACHVFCNVLKSLCLPHETDFELPKTWGDRQFLTILTSKSPSCHGVMQILPS